MAEDVFLAHYLKKDFCHVVGKPGRFSSLLSWRALNQILDEHRLDYPRLRLIRGGETLPPQSFIRYQTDRRGSKYPRVDAAGLSRELATGAMLHLAAVDETQPVLASMAQGLRTALRTDVTINVCAGVNDSRGFATHWDGHDVLVMQIHGRKYWRVYGITQPSPLRIGVGMDTSGETERPSEPTWEGMIEEGDVLYLPRGCWHSAQGNAGPTLHLTVGLINPTGADYLAWVSKGLLANDLFRMDLPDLHGLDVRAEHVAALCKLVATAMSAASLDQFLAEIYDGSQPSRKPALPEILA
jgi:ribosomal protein L16 Arg81 hydroxylase